MKIAIVCDWLVTYAGSERVLGELLLCFPEADIFAVVDFVAPDQRHFLQNKPVKTTFIQKLPFAKKRYRHYLPLMTLAIEQLDVSSYDLIISSSHAVAKGVITGPDQLHISYTYSPMRYAWDLQHQYLKETGNERGIKGSLVKYLLHKMRLWDYRTANGVDHFITSSQFIARRIWKTYRREAEVIAPPVDTVLFTPHAEKENFYLAASRLVPYKRMDLIVESFAKMPDKKLVVIGSGPELAKIKAKATKNVEILGFQPTEILKHYLQRAKALIFAAEEDFGIVPLEAQACGTPVIAFGKGGALETITGFGQPDPTGLFFPEQTVESICQAVALFEANVSAFTVENCVKNARSYTSQIFREKIKKFVQEKCDSVQG
ncbi:MAG: glycosyltransferase family 4 protein [Gammaproteobacteria bacterium]|nr:glycosyltransferase family 4 protein [Gammaproteobacteria bacterium]